MRKISGFTLVELIIVITVMMILMTLGGSSYLNSQRSGRDAHRKGDMKALQEAFEQYYPDHDNQYEACDVMAANYIRGGYPTDPRGAVGGHADYNNNCNTTGYCVCALMERDNTGNACSDACDFNVAGCAGAVDWYCVENQQ